MREGFARVAIIFLLLILIVGGNDSQDVEMRRPYMTMLAILVLCGARIIKRGSKDSGRRYYRNWHIGIFLLQYESIPVRDPNYHNCLGNYMELMAVALLLYASSPIAWLWLIRPIFYLGLLTLIASLLAFLRQHGGD